MLTQAHLHRKTQAGKRQRGRVAMAWTGRSAHARERSPPRVRGPARSGLLSPPRAGMLRPAEAAPEAAAGLQGGTMLFRDAAVVLDERFKKLFNSNARLEKLY